VIDAIMPALTMLLGVALGTIGGYLSQRAYEVRLLRRYAPIVFYAPMSTTPPTMTVTVTDWTEVDT
jgi:hypothetical protein